MSRLRLALAAVVALASLAVSGCATDPLAEDYLNGGNENYISGEGITEVPLAKRGDPIEFSGLTDQGTEVSRSDYAGEVLVVNFWYASCPPCRTEAPDLDALAEKYAGAGASFIGVNIYDAADTSLAFARTFNIDYPSLLDSQEGKVRLAFAGDISPKAVPTTFVLDREGRIAARILGQLRERSILDTIVADLVKEPAG